MDISNRLKAIINQIAYDKIADIGCDHGYISIFAILTAKAKYSIACDVNTGPLERAKKNIAANQLEEKIETRLGYGLKPIQKDEVDSVVIAGMGGMLVMEILEQSKIVVEHTKQLVLQPQHDMDEVRKYVHKVGFAIRDEIMVEEEEKFYNILNCQKGIDEGYTEIDYLLGRKLIEKKDPVLKLYIHKENLKLQCIISGIKYAEKATEASINHLEALEERYKKFRLVEECL